MHTQQRWLSHRHTSGAIGKARWSRNFCPWHNVKRSYVIALQLNVHEISFHLKTDWYSSSKIKFSLHRIQYCIWQSDMAIEIHCVIDKKRRVEAWSSRQVTLFILWIQYLIGNESGLMNAEFVISSSILSYIMPQVFGAPSHNFGRCVATTLDVEEESRGNWISFWSFFVNKKFNSPR